MDLLNSKPSNQQTQDLRSLVETLQSALYNHKQHIANEIKNSLSTEFSISLNTYHQNIIQKFSEATLNMEKEIKLEFNSISHRIESVETRLNEFHSQLSAVKAEFSGFNQSSSENFQLIKEKLLVLELQSENIKKNLKKIDEFISNIEPDNRSYCESLINSGLNHKITNSIDSCIKSQLESHKLDCYMWVNSEINKINELVYNMKVNQTGLLFEKTCIDENGVKGEEDSEVYKIINKCLVNFGNLRIRIEKLEANDLINENFRRSFNNT